MQLDGLMDLCYKVCTTLNEQIAVYYATLAPAG